MMRAGLTALAAAGMALWLVGVAGAQVTVDGDVSDLRAQTGVMVEPDIYPLTQPEVGNPPATPPPNNNPILGTSGFDIREFLLLVEPSNDRIYWAITTYGIPGDGDGDGNPDANATNLLNNNGFLIVDVPGVGSQDFFQMDIDFNPEVAPQTYDLRIQVNSGAINFINLATLLPVGVPQSGFALGNGTGDDGCEVRVNGFSTIVNLINPAFVNDYTWKVRFFADTETDDSQEDDHSGTVDVPPEVCCQSLTSSPTTTTAGGSVTECVNVINNGPGTASFNLTIPKPSGFATFTLNPGSPPECTVLPSGDIQCTNVSLAQSAIFTLCWTAVVSASPPATISTCATLTGNTPTTVCSSPPCCATVSITPTPGVPTLSEWAAILLSVTLMGLLVVYNRRRDSAWAAR